MFQVSAGPLGPVPDVLWLELRVVSASLPPQDITSLLHTIYEVVDSSVNHSPTSSKTLRVKLTVAPDGSQGKRSTLLNHPGEGGVLGASLGASLWTGGMGAGP